MTQIKPGSHNDCGWLQDKLAAAADRGGNHIGEANASKSALQVRPEKK